MRYRLGILLTCAACLAAFPVAGAAQTEPATAASDSTDGSWLNRTLKRYFGDEAPSGEELGGRSIDMVDPYAGHAGKPIEVVIISQVDNFDDEWSQGRDTGAAVLTSVTRPFQTYTRDSTIRQYVLFAQGEKVDPYRIADTERLLRSLDYIEDVRIILVPLAGEIESVAVVIETRDRWPFGVSGSVKGVGWYDLNLYSYNVAGRGIRFENQLLVRRGFDPDAGYRGVLRKGNIGGSFVTGTLEYEDSYRRLLRLAGIGRDAVHPEIKAVGGIGWRRSHERDTGGVPDERETGDYWGGWVLPLRERASADGAGRPILVPAVRFTRTTFLQRPVVTRDSLRSYHNGQEYLLGLMYQRLEYYRTSYLFGMGETENLPSGLTVKVSGGYQDGEYNDRALFSVENVMLRARESGAVLTLRANLGGFFRSGVYEDGTLVLGGAYVTPVARHDNWRYRFIGRAYYHRAINSVGDRALELGDSRGLRGLENGRIYGNQRLLTTLEHRAFTPWSILGFRIMLQGFVDVGTVVAEDDPLLQGKFYVSGGLGARIRNPELVFPTVQLRVALLNTIDDKGVQVGFEVGNAGDPDIRVPGARPGGFEFR